MRGPIGGRVVPTRAVPPPPRAATPAQKQATVWAAEQVFGSGRPGVVMPPPPKPVPASGPARWSIVANTKAPGQVKGRVSPMPVAKLMPQPALSTRYRWAKQAPVNLKARQALVATMTPHRRAAVAQAAIPQLPQHSGGGFFSDPLGLHAIAGLPGSLASAVRGVPSTVEGGSAALWHALNQPLFSEKYARGDVGFAKDVYHSPLARKLARTGVGLESLLVQPGAAGQLVESKLSGKQLTPQQQVQQESLAAMYPTLKNVAIAGAGGAYAARHPVYFATKAYHYGASVLRGTTQLGAALPALAMMSSQQRHDFFTGAIDQAKTSFQHFSQLTPQQAFAHGQADPANALMNLVAVVDPMFKGAGMLKAGELPIVSNMLHAGFSIQDSLDHVKQLRIMGQDVGIEKPLPRGIVARQVARGGYKASEGIERLGGRDVPFVRRLTETGRAARQFTRLQKETQTRDLAQAAAVYRDIKKVTRGRLGKHLSDQEIRLVLEHQMPSGYTHEQWLGAIAEDMRQQLAGRAFETPGGKESPSMARARTRAERFVNDAERATQAQRIRSIVGISGEQQRLSGVLANLNESRSAIRGEMRRINADETLSDGERTAQLTQQQARLKTLDKQAADARESLGHLTVDQAPIDTPARTQFINTLKANGNFDEQQINDYLQIYDSVAHAWSLRSGEEPAAWWEQHQFVNADESQIPAEAYGQVREPYQVFDEKKMTARLRSKLNPRYKDRFPANPRTRQLVRHVATGSAEDVARINGQRGLHVFGEITPEAWVKRLVHTMPTQEERNYMAKWYTAVQPLFDQVFGKHADRMLRAFAVSQANASPTSGLQAVLKVADKLNRGEQVGAKEISTVVKSIEAAYKGEPVTKGVAAKLSDFIDSMIGSKTRTWMGHDPRGGSPAAIDIHALRDLGYVDRRLVARLEKRGFIEGKDFVVDSKGVATGPTYERASEKYQQITDHLNKMDGGKGFDGRNDWQPAEVQALGWSAIQKFHGTTPEDLQYAIDRSTQRIQAPEATARQINSVIKDEGGFVTRSGKGWADGVMTEQMADRITQRLADEHGEARAHWLSNKSKAKRPLLRIQGRVGPKLGKALEEAGFTHSYRAGGEWVFRADGKVIPRKLAATLAEHKPNVVFNGKVQESVKFGEREAAHAGVDYHRPVDANRGVAVGLRGQRPRPDVRFAEGAEPRQFLDAAARNPRQDFLTPHTPETLAEHRLFLSEDGHTGYAISPEGDLQNVFRNPDGIPGSGITAVDHAVDNGARTLDAFGGTLPKIYKDAGFGETGRMAWDDQYAPDNWDYAEHGRPDVVFMAHGAEDTPGRYFDNWDEGKADSRARVPAGPTPLRYMQQARRGDLLGAVHYVDSPAGQRIVYLTQHADVSTVLHEMVGHAVGEMKRFYPEEFAPVEALIGKPLEQWDIADHESFARMAERYFLEGKAPTPELVNAFGRIKSWMRAIYAGVKQRLGGRLDPAMRNLLDHYLGGYDEPTVSRIGLFFGPERAFSEAQAARGVAAKAVGEYERLQKAQATREFNASIEGKKAKLQSLMNQEGLSPEQEAQAEKLTGEIEWHEADAAAKDWKRQYHLKQKLGDLEKALAKPGDTSEHQAARDALQFFSDDQERIYREVFGDQYDEIFSQRKDLIAQFLVDHHLIEPDFEPGSGNYFPSSMMKTKARAGFRSGGGVFRNTGRVVAQLKRDRLNLYKQNNMVLWQRGDWNADPMVMVEAHGRAQGFAYQKEMRDTLYEIGRDLTKEEADGFKDLPPVVFINKFGTPIGPGLRSVIEGTGSETHNVQDFFAGAQGGDNEAAQNAFERYANAIFIDPAGKAGLPEGVTIEDMRALAHDPNQPIRVIPKSVYDMLAPPMRGPSSGLGKTFDFAMSLARWALIYANAPGYMLVNGIGNLGYLLGQQGPFRLPWMINNARRLIANRKLLDMIGGETGELPLMATIAHGSGPGRIADRAYALEHTALNKISAVDRYPRALAWMYEAGKRGFKSDAEMMQLIKGGTPTLERKRMLVGDLARNHMVDFDRLTPFERNTITRALFVYPWVRGATAWPFWFAKQYPVRTAAVAAAAQQLDQRRAKILGPTPPWYEGLFPLGPATGGGKRADVLNAAPFSPTATAGDSLRMLHDVIGSIAGDKPTNVTGHIVDMLAPQWRTGIQAATGINQFGKNVSLQSILAGSLGSMVPGYRLANAIVNPDTAPKIYTDASVKAQAERTFLRVTPSEISIPRLNAEAPPNKPTVSEQIAAEEAQGKKTLAKLAPGTPWDQRMQRAAVIRTTYEAQRTALEKQMSKSRQWDPKKLSSGGYEKTPKLTPMMDAHLMYITVKHFLPGLSETDLPDPQTLLRLQGPSYAPGTFLGNQLLTKYRNVVYSAYGTSTEKIIKQGQKLAGAERAGLTP